MYEPSQTSRLLDSVLTPEFLILGLIMFAIRMYAQKFQDSVSNPFMDRDKVKERVLLAHDRIQSYREKIAFSTGTRTPLEEFEYRVRNMRGPVADFHIESIASNIERAIDRDEWKRTSQKKSSTHPSPEQGENSLKYDY